MERMEEQGTIHLSLKEEAPLKQHLVEDFSVNYLSSLGLSAFYLVLCNEINFRVTSKHKNLRGELG